MRNGQRGMDGVRWALVAVIWMVAMWGGPVWASGEAQGGEADEKVWTLAVMADLNGAFGSKEYNEHVHGAVQWLIDDGEADAVLIAGDMVAGQMEGLDYSGMWEAFHEVVTRPLREAGLAVAVTPGNHDGSERPRFWRERVEFARQWERYRPQVAMIDDEMYPFYYAFEVGPATVISMDGTGVGRLDEAHIDWMMSLPGSGTGGPVFVMSHLPQYPVAQGREVEIFDDPQLEDFVEEVGPAAMISGHHHAYYPARVGETLFLHAGALGSGVRPLLGEDEPGERVLSLVHFDEDGVVGLEARVGPDFERHLENEALPDRLVMPSGRRVAREALERWDGVGDDGQERSEGASK